MGLWRSALAALPLLFALLMPAAAREVAIRGSTEAGFGRIEIRFDETTKVDVRSNGSILVVGFSAPARVTAEKLVDELPGYVSAVRRDPDGTGFRLALTRPFRANRLEAGERVFVDLLPEKWSGLPPALPPHVVAELAERARLAETRLREAGLRSVKPVGIVRFRIARNAEATQLVFEPPTGTAMKVIDGRGGSEIRLEGSLALEEGGERPRTEDGVAEFAAVREGDGLNVKVLPVTGRTVRAFVDGGSAVIEIALPRAATPTPTPSAVVPPQESRPASPTSKGSGRETPSEKAAVAVRPVAAAEPPALPAQAERSPMPANDAAPEPSPRTMASGGMVLPFTRPTPVAAFERGGRTTFVFQTNEKLPATIPTEANSLGLLTTRQDGGFAVLTFAPSNGVRLRLQPEGSAWRVMGGNAAPLPDDVLVSRSAGMEGSGEISAAITASGLHWLLGPDDVPMAVVTTLARQGLVNPRRFVDFQMLSTLQGLVVLPTADDVRVALARGGVVVSRKAGLALSQPGRGGSMADEPPLVVRADSWDADTSGDALARIRDALLTISEASRNEKSGLRLRLAHRYLANGLAHEAMGVVATAMAEDPTLGGRREAVLLAGIAAARAGHPEEARRFLQSDAASKDPETQLWLAVMDAEAGDHARALAGFRRGNPVIASYPDELAGEIRVKMLESAAMLGDSGTAEEMLAELKRLPAGTLHPARLDLARAIVDEVRGRNAPALETYNRLAGSAEAPQPIWAAATLRGIVLARRIAQVPIGEAINQLETLTLVWRGDDVELEALARLTRLYAENRQWRSLFETARLVNARFPGRDRAREVQDEAAARFETLFLQPVDADTDAVSHLALYYDFREFAPVGRRGDEVVRRVADRLVEIDLVDQAATLLQYQVDNRLTGMARTIVATRLASLQLMNGKPSQALATLIASRMAELPPDLRRLRRIVEAQAQADLGRVEMALEALEGETGSDFQRLRATILFDAGRWQAAGERYEEILGVRWQSGEPLSDTERADVVRALLAAMQADERMAVDRIRAKFAVKMADSPDAKLFDALLQPNAMQSPEYRTAMRQAGSTSNLRRFLGDWSRVSDLPPEEDGRVGKGASARSARRAG